MKIKSTTMPKLDKNDCDLFVRCPQVSVIKSVFDVLKEILFEATICVDDTGLKVVSMDSSKTSLVHLKLDAGNFDEFHLTRPMTLGVSVMTLYRLIKTATVNDVITLCVKAESDHELIVLIESTTATNASMFTIKLLDLPVQNIAIPDFEYANLITLQSHSLQKIFRDMSHIGNEVTLSTNGKRLSLSCSGDFATQSTWIGDDRDDPDTVSAKYLLKYLQLFSKSSAISNNVAIYIDADKPLILEFDVGSLGRMKFLLSPMG